MLNPPNFIVFLTVFKKSDLDQIVAIYKPKPGPEIYIWRYIYIYIYAVKFNFGVFSYVQKRFFYHVCIVV